MAGLAVFSGVDFWGRNCVIRARRRGVKHAVNAIEKRGFHALSAPEIYTSEYRVGKKNLF